MSSERRQVASRANGAKSRGPVSDEGKRRSSINATRHGLLADVTVLPFEDRRNFEELVNQHVAHFQPANDIEMGFIEEMCNAYWRLRRLWAIEKCQLDKAIGASGDNRSLEALAAAFTDLASTPTPALIHRYETRLHRMYQRAMNNLFRLREKSWLLEPAPPPVRALEAAPEEHAPEVPVTSVSSALWGCELGLFHVSATRRYFKNLPNEPEPAQVGQASPPVPPRKSAQETRAVPLCALRS
jgi:hypothetical protein